MSFRSLKNYLSRSQIREFLEHLKENGVADVIQSPDQTDSSEPIGVRIGSALNSIRQFHAERYIDYYINEGSYAFCDDDVKPELPPGTAMVGIVYMSKERDYSAEADKLGDVQYKGDIGDIAWFEASEWDQFTLGKTQEGINYRLFAFWGKVDVLRT